MADLMQGSSGYQTGSIDTASTITNNVTATDAKQPNGLAAAIIQIETILGIGPTLKGSLADLVARLAVFLGSDGKAKDFSSTTKTTFPPTVAEGCTGITSLTANGIPYGNGTGPIQVTAAGTSAQVLIGGSPPSFQDLGPTQFDSTRVLDRSSADVTVDNTASEISLYSFSVPGGNLSTNRVIRATMYITNQGSTGGDTGTFRLKYGATTVATAVVGSLPIGPSGRGYAIFHLYADGTTSSQRGMIDIVLDDGTTRVVSTIVGTSSEDSTAAKTFEVTYQHSTAGVSRGLVKRHAMMERI